VPTSIYARVNVSEKSSHKPQELLFIGGNNLDLAGRTGVQ